MDERIPYEEFLTNMKKHNDEQRCIIDDIIHKKHKYPSKPLHIFFNRRCNNRENFHISVYHTKHVKILYKKHSKCWPFKTKIMKLTCIGEVVFTINGMTIQLALAIPLNKKIQWTQSIKWWKNDNLI